MTTTEVAQKLVQHCREGKNIDAIEDLYADNVVSYEAKGSPIAVTQGKEGVLGKTKYWYDSVQEIHSGVISDPIVTGNFFAVTMEMDVTYKEGGRMPMNEIAVYEVKEGKIIAEEFFYNMG